MKTKLTDRQRQIACGYFAGLTTKQIAGRLKISIKAITYHWLAMKKQCGVQSYVDLVHRMYQGTLAGAFVVLTGCTSVKPPSLPPYPPGYAPPVLSIKPSVEVFKTSAPPLLGAIGFSAAPHLLSIPTLPAISIQMSGGDVVLSCPVNYARNYVLAATGVSAPWALIPRTMTTNAGRCSLTLPRTNAAGFYRLRSVSGQANVNLAWNASLDPNVTGYNLYRGSVSRNYTSLFNCGNVTNYTLTNIVAGANNYIAATAYNVVGMQSDYSIELVYFAP